jgi:hypothetical protein
VAILNDLVPGLRVNRRELDLAREHLLRPLNEMLHAIADQQGWTFAGGIFDSFRNHGYSAKEPWFIREKESEQLQGPILTPVGILRGETATGTLHPNHQGRRFIADRLHSCLGAKRPSQPAEPEGLGFAGHHPQFTGVRGTPHSIHGVIPVDRQVAPTIVTDGIPGAPEQR